MVHMSFTRSQSELLIKLAREAIAAKFENVSSPPEPLDSHWLTERKACFVTLMLNQQLRGCIGSLNAIRPLWQEVWNNAQAAAFSDPRFPPLEKPELDHLLIEISVLTQPKQISVESETELLQRLRPGRDGLVIEEGDRRATFLPSVWVQLPEPERFLAQLKRKAGLSEDYWSDQISCSLYQVDKISEQNRAS